MSHFPSRCPYCQDKNIQAQEGEQVFQNPVSKEDTPGTLWVFLCEKCKKLFEYFVQER